MMVIAGESMDRKLSKEIQTLGNDLSFLSGPIGALASLHVYDYTRG